MHSKVHYAVAAPLNAPQYRPTSVRLYVLLSVPLLILSRERNYIGSWKLAEKAHDTDDPWRKIDSERSKVKVTRPINAETENAPKERPTNFKLGTGMEYALTHISDMRGDVKGLVNKVISSVWCTFPYNSTTKSRRNTTAIICCYCLTTL